MCKLSFEVIMSNTENVELFLLGINFDVVWVVGLEKCVGLVAELTNGSVSGTSLMHVVLNPVAYQLLQSKENDLEQSELVEELTGPNLQRSLGFQLLEELWRSCVFIAIVDFAILQSNSVNHGVTIETVMTIV